MQSVFRENKRINIRGLDNYQEGDINLVVEKGSGFDLQYLSKMLESISETGTINLISSNPQWLLEFFSSLFVKKIAAGGLVQNTKGDYLLIFKSNHWDLPKGHIDGDESLEQAAKREVEEECGIGNLQIINRLPNTYHVFETENHEWILKESLWFFMKTPSLEKPKAQYQEGIVEARWVNPEEVGSMLENAFASIKQVVLSHLDSTT